MEKKYAVIGYLNAWIQKDTTGNIYYEYEDEVVITHRHNF